MSRHILITGATGALGKGVMPALLASMPDARFTVLTRRPGQQPAVSRVAELRCDLTDSRWLRSLPDDLAHSVTGILHMAADVRWNATVEDALKMNTSVCAALADWAQSRCDRLEVFCYVSTAYVEAPSHLKCSPGFIQHEDRLYNNSYEYSKNLGEREVLARKLPSVIVRPSLILGDSRTGEIGSFNGLYTLLRFASQGLVPVVAGAGQAYVDTVSLDTVVDAILLALKRAPEPAGRIIWAISGEDAPRVEDLMNACVTGLNQFRTTRGASPIEPPAVVRYETYRRLYRPWFEQQASSVQKQMLEYIDVFTPYFSMTGVFRPEASHDVLTSPNWRTALPKIVGYWCETNQRAALKPLRPWKSSSISTQQPVKGIADDRFSAVPTD
ncbi:SDR family oxidoreductase [Ralstonia pseudosolanacearum]